MKVLLHRRFILLLLVGISPLLAWGQTPVRLPGTASGRVSMPASKPIAVDSLGTVQSQPLTPPKVVSSRADNSQPIHRMQLPNRTPPTLPVLAFFSAALGALLFMGLFTVAQFLLNRDASYGWYAAYLTMASIWLWQSTRIWFSGTAVPTDMTAFFACMMLLGYGMMIAYIRFVSYLLEVAQQPRLGRLTRHFLRFAGLSVLILLAELLIWNSIYVYILVNLLNYGGLFFLMTSMLRKKHPLKRYALAGSLFLVIGAITATFMNYIGSSTTILLLRMPLFYLVVSQLLEILCFSLALGRRSYLNKMEKIQAQQQLIQQLEENQHLQQTYTVELERQLGQRELRFSPKLTSWKSSALVSFNRTLFDELPRPK
jgi:hypothetical protein